MLELELYVSFINSIFGQPSLPDELHFPSSIETCTRRNYLYTIIAYAIHRLFFISLELELYFQLSVIDAAGDITLAYLQLELEQGVYTAPIAICHNTCSSNFLVYIDDIYAGLHV